MTLIQRNHRTGTRRKLRFYESGDQCVAWYFERDDGGEELSHALSCFMEAREKSGILRNAGYDPSRAIMHTSVATYSLTFAAGGDRGVQTNMDTGRTRNVRRGTTTLLTALQTNHLSDGVDDDDDDDDDMDDVAIDAPTDLCCPITHKLFRHPVEIADGKVYERSAIRRWFSIKLTSPLTGLPLTSSAMTAHEETLQAVKRFRALHPSADPV